MAPESSLVLLICADRDAAAQLASLIQAPGRRVVAAPYGPAALARAPEAQLILVDNVAGSPDSSRAVSHLRTQLALATTPLLCVAGTDDVEERVRLLDAGADDVVARPFHPDELRARIDALLATPHIEAPVAGELAAVAAPAVRRRRLISFFSPKGGVGTTTLAVNTAISAAGYGRTVALVDLDLEWGQVATHLNVAPRFSVVELARDAAALEDPELIRSYAERHPSSVSVFAAPLRPDQSELLSGDHVRRLLDALASTYDQTIVDGGNALNERSLTLLEQSERVVLIATPEIPAVRAMHTLLEMLTEMGAAPERQFLVLNHLFEHDMLRLDDLERSVQATIQAELPYDPITYLRAVNEGVPVLAAAKRGSAASSLERVVAAILEEPVAAAESASATPSRFKVPKLSIRTALKSRT